MVLVLTGSCSWSWLGPGLSWSWLGPGLDMALTCAWCWHGLDLVLKGSWFWSWLGPGLDRIFLVTEAVCWLRVDTASKQLQVVSEGFDLLLINLTVFFYAISAAAAKDVQSLIWNCSAHRLHRKCTCNLGCSLYPCVFFFQHTDSVFFLGSQLCLCVHRLFWNCSLPCQ